MHEMLGLFQIYINNVNVFLIFAGLYNTMLPYFNIRGNGSLNLNNCSFSHKGLCKTWLPPAFAIITTPGGSIVHLGSSR